MEYSIGRTNLDSNAYTDLNSLNSIKSLGRDQDPKAIAEVAKQFESFFISQLLKEMRKTTDTLGEDNFLNSNEMKYHQQMFDQQLSLALSKNGGIGIAKILEQQLNNQFQLDWGKEQPTTAGLEPRQLNNDSLAYRKIIPVNNFHGITQDSIKQNDFSDFTNKADFIETLKPYAKKAASQLNINEDVLLAQAALETGWGKHIAQDQSGYSYNLFNIKSDSRWNGQAVRVNTLEFNGNVAYQEQADFRSYQSFSESFEDYVSFIQSNPRYQNALAVAENPKQYVEELQKAGYATDPNYAEKIIQLLDQPEFK